MCMIIYSPTGRLDLEKVERASKNNPHGAGYWTAQNGIWKCRDNEPIMKWLRDYKAAEPILIHFRWATHGPRTFENCHPFYVNSDWVLAHNGILDHPRPEPERSDTRVFVEDILGPLLNQYDDLLDNPAALALLRAYCRGSRVILVSVADGHDHVMLGSAGHWVDDIWYSTDPAPRPIITRPIQKEFKSARSKNPLDTRTELMLSADMLRLKSGSDI